MRFAMTRAGAILLVLWMAAPAAAEQAECLVRFGVAGATGEAEAPTLVCRDGDAACDRDGTENGSCRVGVGGLGCRCIFEHHEMSGLL